MIQRIICVIELSFVRYYRVNITPKQKAQKTDYQFFGP